MSNIGLILLENLEGIMVGIPSRGVQLPVLVVICNISPNFDEDESINEELIEQSDLLNSSSWLDNMFSNSPK